MAASAIGGMSGKHRPFGISILAVLAAISFVFGLLALFGGTDEQGGAFVVFAITAVAALDAYGLWNLRPWAWPLALAAWALGTIDAVILLSAGTINSNLVVGPIAIAYLLRADIRALFQRDG
jgi:hypothetical protein